MLPLSPALGTPQDMHVGSGGLIKKTGDKNLIKV